MLLAEQLEAACRLYKDMKITQAPVRAATIGTAIGSGFMPSGDGSRIFMRIRLMLIITNTPSIRPLVICARLTIGKVSAAMSAIAVAAMVARMGVCVLGLTADKNFGSQPLRLMPNNILDPMII